MASGKRRAERQSHAGLHLGPLSRLGATVLGMVVGAFAWWYLVRAAIAFGRVARAGQQGAWMFTASACIGAMLCLVLVLVLLSRVLVTLGVVREYQGRRATPRRAAPRRTDEAAATPRRAEEAAAPTRRAADEDVEPARRAADEADAPARRSTDKTSGPGRRMATSTHGRRVAHRDAPQADGTSG